MARQLVFTSAPQGLTPGRTGYGTVARHRDLRERLVPILERLSTFPSDWQPAPVICAFRLVEVGGTRVPVLTRVMDAGHDYTHRSHYLAHHLVFDPDELPGAPTPADIFLRWDGWLAKWDGPPRWLEDHDLVDVTRLPAVTSPALPAKTWQRLTGEAGHAVLLTEGTQASSRTLRCSTERENDLIHLLRESSALLPSAECWRAEFTTCLQPQESVTGYRWAGVRAGSPSDTAAIRTGALLDLTQPAGLPPPPATPLARLAREGPLQPKAPAAVAASPVRQQVLLVKPEQLKKSPEPNVIRLPVKRIPKPAAKPAFKQAAAVIAGIVTALVIIGAAWFWLKKSGNSAPSASSASSTSASPPMPVFNPAAATPASTTTANTATGNEATLLDIQQLAGNRKFLDALTKWKLLTKNAPDVALAHMSLLTIQLLPGARKEWLATIDHLKTLLAAGPAGRADAAAQFEALRDFPQTWPVANPTELIDAANAMRTVFKLLDQLPDAPVYVIDGFTTAGAGADYQDASASVTLPELSAILAASEGQFHAAAAPATSLAPPPAAQWFNFDVQAPDFASGDFLILADASRGDAGGRFLQLLADGPGKTRILWRLFQAQSDFFKRFPANTPLGPISRLMWLHFTGQPPLASFYLLLRRPDNPELLPWKPLAMPMAWLEAKGTPAQVSLPPWLAANLPLHALPGQSFHLEPTLLIPSLEGLSLTDASGATTPSAIQFKVATLANQLNDKIRTQQTEQAQAQKDLDDLQAALSGPVEHRPTQAVIDEAALTVKNLERSIATEQAASETVSKEDWPQQAAPWMLYDRLAANGSLIFLQFTPHETGSTP